MNMKDTLKKDLGTLFAKTVAASVLGNAFGAHQSENSPTSAASSAWKEIEQKLHGLFGSADAKAEKARERRRHVGALLLVVLALLVIAYLLGRRQATGRATVLEVHQA